MVRVVLGDVEMGISRVRLGYCPVKGMELSSGGLSAEILGSLEGSRSSLASRRELSLGCVGSGEQGPESPGKKGKNHHRKDDVLPQRKRIRPRWGSEGGETEGNNLQVLLAGCVAEEGNLSTQGCAHIGRQVGAHKFESQVAAFEGKDNREQDKTQCRGKYSRRGGIQQCRELKSLNQSLVLVLGAG